MGRDRSAVRRLVPIITAIGSIVVLTSLAFSKDSSDNNATTHGMRAGGARTAVTSLYKRGLGEAAAHEPDTSSTAHSNITAMADTHSSGGEHAVEAHGGEHESMEGGIFFVALDIEQSYVGIMMTVIILITILLDEGLNHLQSHLGKTARILLDKVYKELATLGIISFGLFLVQTFDPHLSHDTLLAFEYSHILIFAMAIIYVVQSAVLIRSIHPVKGQLMELNTRAIARATGAASPVNKRGDSDWGFASFRKKFLHLHSLPPTFLYDRYLASLYKKNVTSKLEIRWTSWAFLVAVFVLEIIVAKLAPESLNKALLHCITFVVYGWAILGIDLLLYLLVRRVHRRVLTNLAKEESGEVPEGYKTDHNALEMLKVRKTELTSGALTEGGDKDRHHHQQQQATHGGKHPSSTAIVTAPSKAAVVGGAGSLDGDNDHLPPAVMQQQQQKLSPRFLCGSSSHRGDYVDMEQQEEARQRGSRRSTKGAEEAAAAVGTVRGEEGGRGYGYGPWESALMTGGTELMSLIRCLYLAAYLTAFVGKNILVYNVWTATVLDIITPIPALISSLFLVPRMAVSFLLVRSLSTFSIPSLEAVIQYMESVESSFEAMAHLVQRYCDQQPGVNDIEKLFQSFDSDGSGEVSYQELRDGLSMNGIRLPHKDFMALCRFVDKDLNRNIDLQEFKAVLIGRGLFNHQHERRPTSKSVFAAMYADATMPPPPPQQQEQEALGSSTGGSGGGANGGPAAALAAAEVLSEYDYEAEYAVDE